MSKDKPWVPYFIKQATDNFLIALLEVAREQKNADVVRSIMRELTQRFDAHRALFGIG